MTRKIVMHTAAVEGLGGMVGGGAGADTLQMASAQGGGGAVGAS